MADNQYPYSRLWQQFTDYAKLNIEYARLTAAEKVTVLLTAAAVAIGAFVLGVIFFFFMSLAIAYWLSAVIPLAWAYALMSFVYLILIALLILLRKPLILNPVSKFVSRLFLS